MPSFDIVSEVNLQEVKNAVEHVKKEISTRYDFKGSKSSVELDSNNLITIIADDNMKLQAVQDLVRQKLAKRGVSPKSVKFNDPVPAASNTLRQEVVVKQGLTDEELKRISKLIKEKKLKVTGQIQDQQVRVSGKKRDDLQEIMAYIRASVTDLDLQFLNFRD